MKIIVLLISFVIASSHPLYAQRPKAKNARREVAKNAGQVQMQLHSGIELLKAGDSLADAGKPNEAQGKYHEAMEKILPSVRKLPFAHTVKRDETPREELGKVLIGEWEKDITPEEFHLDEMTWKTLGLIPPEFDLKSAYIQLLSEEVAAFYDPKTRTMHLIREPEKKQGEAAAKPRGLLDLILNGDGGFNKEEAQSVIAHELTHALDDQHFGLQAMMDKVKDDDDAMLALSALMEGEATLTMMAVGQQDWDGSQIIQTPSAGVQRLVRWFGPLLPVAGGEAARKSPPVMYETLIFPYFQGLVFCTALTNNGGWKSLDQAYANPPISTEQILHPEKYWGPLADAPMKIELGEIVSPDGFKFIGTSVIGEFTTRQLLSRHGGRMAAEGWDGDALAVFQSNDKPKTESGFAWMSTWDSAQDSLEFARSAMMLWSPEKPDLETSDKLLKQSGRYQSGGFIIEMRDKDVLIVQGLPRASAETLNQQLWKDLRKSPKAFSWDKPK